MTANGKKQQGNGKTNGKHHPNGGAADVYPVGQSQDEVQGAIAAAQRESAPLTWPWIRRKQRRIEDWFPN